MAAQASVASLDKVRALLDKPYARDLFGIELIEVGAGAITLAIACRPELCHSPGWFQGAVTTAIGEYAAAWAGMTLLPPDWTSMTLEQSIHFVGAARGDRLVAIGSIVVPGRSIATARADVFAEVAGERTLCGVLMQTNRHAPPRP